MKREMAGRMKLLVLLLLEKKFLVGMFGKYFGA